MNRLAAFRTSIIAAAALALSACGINSVPAAEETAKAKWADVEAALAASKLREVETFKPSLALTTGGTRKYAPI